MTAEDLARLLQRVYVEFLPAFDEQHGRGHCREIAAIGHVLAQALGLCVILCRGWRQMPGNIKDQHSWLQLPDGRILHCVRRGEVELRWPQPGEFQATMRVGV